MILMIQSIFILSTFIKNTCAGRQLKMLFIVTSDLLLHTCTSKSLWSGNYRRVSLHLSGDKLVINRLWYALTMHCKILWDDIWWIIKNWAKKTYFKLVNTHFTNTEYSRVSDILTCFDKSIPINLHCTDCVEDEKYKPHNIWCHKYCIAKSRNAGA